MRLALPQPFGGTTAPNFTPIRVGRIGQIVRDRWRLIVGAVVLCLLLATAYVRMAPRSYSATATVTLEQRQREVVEGEQVLSNLPVSLGGVADTQVELLKSPAVAQAAAARLGVDRARRLLNSQDPRRNGDSNTVLTAAAEAISRSIVVVRLGMSFAISVSARADDPVLAADIANAVVNSYLAAQLREKNSATDEAATYLRSQINQLRGDVRQAEQAVSSYQAANGLLESTGGDLTEQRMSEFQRQEAEAQAVYSEKTARLEAARRQLSNGAISDGSIGEGQNSGVIRDLRAKLADVVQRQSEAEVRYGPKHPQVGQLAEERASLERDLRTESRRIIEGLSADAAAAQGRLASVGASVVETRGSLSRQNGASVALAELVREADAKRSLYKTYLARYQQLMSIRGQATADARLASSAVPQTSLSGPSTTLVYGLAIAVGLLLGLILALIADMLEHRVRSRDDVIDQLDARYLGFVPAVKWDRNVETAALIDRNPTSQYSESFRTLHLAVGTQGETQPQVIAVTSALAGEGKTSTSLALARSAVRSGRSALVIDCDSRRQGFARIMAKAPRVGMAEVVDGTATVEEAIMRDATSGCDFIAAGAAGRRIEEEPSADKVAEIIGALRPSYDIIILDCGPVLAVAEAQARVSLADSTLLLARWRSTPIAALKEAIAVLKQRSAKNIGVVITMIPPGAHYGSNYGYYSKLSEYYTT